MLKVVICDDDDEQSFVFRSWLEECGDFEVVRCCRTRGLAIMACREFKPDVLVMDFAMPGENIDITDLPRQLPDTPVLLWTGFNRTDLTPEVVVSVEAVLVKGIDPVGACQAVRDVAAAGRNEWH